MSKRDFSSFFLGTDEILTVKTSPILSIRNRCPLFGGRKTNTPQTIVGRCHFSVVEQCVHTPDRDPRASSHVGRQPRGGRLAQRALHAVENRQWRGQCGRAVSEADRRMMGEVERGAWFAGRGGSSGRGRRKQSARRGHNAGTGRRRGGVSGGQRLFEKCGAFRIDAFGRVPQLARGVGAARLVRRPQMQSVTEKEASAQ